jgi:hypothetical protein
MNARANSSTTKAAKIAKAGSIQALNQTLWSGSEIFALFAAFAVNLPFGLT